MKILVLGGTSFLGPAIVEDAIARGWEVVLFNRGRTNPHLFPALEKIRGDRTTADVARISAVDCDAVVDTSGYFPAHVRAAAEAVKERSPQYLFVSSVSAFADLSVVGLTEAAPRARLEGDRLARIDALGFEDLRADMSLYGPLKAACEEAAEAVLPGRTTVLRPCFIVGPRDRSNRFHYWPWRMHQGGEILAPGPREVPVQLVDVRDLARFVNHCLAERHVGVHTVAGPAAATPIVELLHACKAATSTVGALTWVSEEFLLGQGATSWSIPFWVAPSDAASRGLQTVDASKARARGLELRPLAETARATLDDALSNGMDARWPHGARMREIERAWLAAWEDGR